MIAIVTKKSVRTTQPKLFSITFNLQVTDGAVVIDKDFSCHYRPGDDVSEKVGKVKEDMQNAINDYKLEKELFDKPALDIAVTSIQGGLSL